MNSLSAGQGLNRGESLSSSTGKFVLALQDDGNLVLQQGSDVVWASGTNGQGIDRLSVQDDGNVVLYSGGDAKWSTGTNGNSGARLELQDDRNVVVYGGDGQALWSTGTDTADGDAPAPAAPAEPAVSAPAPAPAAPAQQTYTVQGGDTLWAIAERYYGDGSQYMKIATANGIANPDLINVGQQLVIP